MYKYKNTVSLLHLLGAIALLGGCRPACDYPYLPRLQQYLAEVHRYQIPEEEVILYITPLDGCAYCVEQNLRVLIRSTSKFLVPVLIDRSYNPNYTELARQVRAKYPQVLEDPGVKIRNYQTGYLNPLLVHLKKGRCVYYMEITDADITAAEKYLMQARPPTG